MRAGFALAFALALALAPACAMAGARFAPAHIAQELPQARPAGKGGFSWFGIRIYEAELWVEGQGYTPGAPLAAPFALDLRYARNLDGRKIAEASHEQMARTGAGSRAERAAWLARMLAIFPDVKQGSHLSGIFRPPASVRFYLDGRPLASVDDAGFARAFFGIWLDPATSAPALRSALLEDAAPR